MEYKQEELVADIHLTRTSRNYFTWKRNLGTKQTQKNSKWSKCDAVLYEEAAVSEQGRVFTWGTSLSSRQTKRLNYRSSLQLSEFLIDAVPLDLVTRPLSTISWLFVIEQFGRRQQHLLLRRRATLHRPAAAVRLTVARPPRLLRLAAVNQRREKEAAALDLA